MNGLEFFLIFFGSMAVMVGIFFLMNWLMPKDMEFPTQHTSTMEKTKCTNCGHRFSFDTKTTDIEWDFTGPDYYKMLCPKCGRYHYVWKYGN